MGTNLEDTMYFVSYRGYKVWKLIKWVQFMETHKEGKMYGE